MARENVTMRITSTAKHSVFFCILPAAVYDFRKHYVTRLFHQLVLLVLSTTDVLVLFADFVNFQNILLVEKCRVLSNE